MGEPIDPRAYAGKDALLSEVRRRVIDLHRALGGAGGDDSSDARGGGGAVARA